jgi:methylmalonyl-CoA mutase N-terminal domain/subunit
VLAYETNVAHVADPLGGSYFVEALTDEMEAQAEAIFAHIDTLGEGSMLEGAIRGIEENWFQGEIAESAYQLERKFNQGRRIVVGVNRFTEGNDEVLDDILEITNADEERQVKRLAAVKQDRDETAVASALARLGAEAAQPDTNLMPTLIDTVNTYATLGEIMNTLAGVFGRHIEVPSI